MFFSIVIPVYNAEKSLRRCLESVKAQTFKDYEVIIVDDGSTDSSGGICREFTGTDVRFRYVFQENRGVSAARNRGMREAAAPFIAFIDCDDEYSEDYLLKFYEVITHDPKCDSFWCGYASIDSERGTRDVIYDSEEKLVTEDRGSIMSLYDGFLAAAVWNKVFRRDIIINNSITMPEDISLGEDLLFNFEYLDNCANTKILLINEPLYRYHCGDGASLNTKYRADLLRIYERLSDGMGKYVDKWDLDQSERGRYYSAVYSMLFRAMKNNYNPVNPMRKKDKLAVNNGVLRSKRFRESVEKAADRIHPLYKKAYSIGDYRLVRLVDKLAETKIRIKR